MSIVWERMQMDINEKLGSLLRGIARHALSSGDERYPQTSTSLPAFPPSRLCSPRKPFTLCFLLLFCSWPTIGFLGFYPNSLEIIGSHNHSFSVMFQTVCLWSHLNFDRSNCVSNETKLLAASESPAQQVPEVSRARQMLHWRLEENRVGLRLCLLRCLLLWTITTFQRCWDHGCCQVDPLWWGVAIGWKEHTVTLCIEPMLLTDLFF